MCDFNIVGEDIIFPYFCRRTQFAPTIYNLQTVFRCISPKHNIQNHHHAKADGK